MQQLINYIFVLSTLYLLVFIFDVILKLRENNPVPIKRNNIEKILLYLTSSFFFYFLIF
jgi:hypothetical protein